MKKKLVHAVLALSLFSSGLNYCFATGPHSTPHTPSKETTEPTAAVTRKYSCGVQGCTNKLGFNEISMHDSHIRQAHKKRKVTCAACLKVMTASHFEHKHNRYRLGCENDKPELLNTRKRKETPDTEDAIASPVFPASQVKALIPQNTAAPKAKRQRQAKASKKADDLLAEELKKIAESNLPETISEKWITGWGEPNQVAVSANTSAPEHTLAHAGNAIDLAPRMPSSFGIVTSPKHSPRLRPITFGSDQWNNNHISGGFESSPNSPSLPGLSTSTTLSKQSTMERTPPALLALRPLHSQSIPEWKLDSNIPTSPKVESPNLSKYRDDPSGHHDSTFSGYFDKFLMEFQY